MTDEECGKIADGVAKVVSALAGAASHKLPPGAPRITLAASVVMSGCVGIEVSVFKDKPTTPQQQDDYMLYGLLLCGRISKAAWTNDKAVAMEMDFQPHYAVDAMNDFEKLTGRRLDGQFTAPLERAIKEEAELVDGLKSQFGQFLPQ